MSVKEPKEIGDVVFVHSLHPTSDNWAPSYERSHEDEPKRFEECECFECFLIPPKEKQSRARYSWSEGGRVACNLYVFAEPKYESYKPKFDDPTYMSRVSFWGLDDLGMEKFFQYEEDARRFVCHLPPYISQEFLYDHGFKII